MGELSLFKLTSETDLGDFYCGLPIMDEFIHSRLQKVLSEHQNYSGYYLRYKEEIVALFVIDIESVILDDDMVDDIQLLCEVDSVAGKEYNSLEILYLAVKESYRKQGIGSVCIDTMLKMAHKASYVGVQFMTVDAYKSASYSAVEFYHRHHFIAAEYPNPNNNTLRMIRPLDM